MGDDEVPQTNQARIHMRSSAIDGFDGDEVEVTVEGGEGESVSDIEDAAARRFAQAVESASPDSEPERGYE
jgi:hypothetical protein